MILISYINTVYSSEKLDKWYFDKCNCIFIYIYCNQIYLSSNIFSSRFYNINSCILFFLITWFQSESIYSRNSYYIMWSLNKKQQKESSEFYLFN